MNEKNRTIIILILGMLSTIGPFTIDMYLPGFPAMARDLKVPEELLSYTLSSYFVGVSLGQLLWGPLLDRFGRKAPMYAGLAIYIAATIGCFITNDINVLIGLRFVQAVGGCIGIVAPRAMVRDFFPVEENAKIFSILILILGVSPIVAPTAGGYIVAHLNWHYVFVFLAIFAAFVLCLVALLLPESAKPDPTYSLKPKAIAQKFASVVKIRSFNIYALVAGFSSAALFAYLSGSPFVFMTFYKTTEQQYGYIFAIIAVGLIICSQLNNLLLRKYSSHDIIKVTISAQTFFGILLVAGATFHMLNLYSTIALIALFLSCQGFTFPNASALTMAPFSKNAGSASALMGASQMGLAALASATVGLLQPKDSLPMMVTMLGCALLAWLLLFFGGAKNVIDNKS